MMMMMMKKKKMVNYDVALNDEYLYDCCDTWWSLRIAKRNDDELSVADVDVDVDVDDDDDYAVVIVELLVL